MLVWDPCFSSLPNCGKLKAINSFLQTGAFLHVEEEGVGFSRQDHSRKHPDFSLMNFYQQMIFLASLLFLPAKQNFGISKLMLRGWFFSGGITQPVPC